MPPHSEMHLGTVSRWLRRSAAVLRGKFCFHKMGPSYGRCSGKAAYLCQRIQHVYYTTFFFHWIADEKKFLSPTTGRTVELPPVRTGERQMEEIT